MKASDLRVGNFVNLYGSQTTIIPNDFQKWFQNEVGWENKVFKPIPLTEEWLLKFGFERKGTYWYKNRFFIEWLFQKPNLRITINSAESAHANSVEYVHQLQNLYFALTGNELTIER